MYWLEVVDHNNCKQRDTVLVRQKECGKRFYVPNIFTPNGDGRNETFKPVLYDNTKQYRFSVYNRWGQLVFTSSEPGKGWDGRINGKSQDANVFLWTCTYQFSGEPVRSEKGTVVLAK
ncbi:gliding motility-associated C-terminal domain-containing protein [Paraflavisolibacter caeni]